MCLVRGNSKLLRIVIMTIFASFFHHVKEDCRGETTSFTNDEQVLFFRKRLLCCSWCTVNFNSYYTSQPNDCALALLRRPGRHLSIKYQTDNQPGVRAYTAHCTCVRESLPYNYYPWTEHKSRNLFHFPFSL